MVKSNDETYMLKEYFEFENRPGLLSLDEQQKVNDDDKMILAGKLQEADAKNGNGRVYPKNVLKTEAERYQKLVEERRALGALDHENEDQVSLQEASHLIIDMWWEGNSLMGKCEVLNTPNGQTLRSLVEDDVKLGISSRAIGSLKEKGGKKVVREDLDLIAFDFVSEPSTAGAYMIQEARERKIRKNLRNKRKVVHQHLDSILKGRR